MSKRTKWLLAIGAIAALVVGWQIAAFASVSSDEGFEAADGNLVHNSAFDWNDFASIPNPNPPPNNLSLKWQPSPSSTPTRTATIAKNGFQFEGIEDWQASGSDSAFAGGTKQDDNCPTVITQKADNKADLKRIYLSTKTVSINGSPHVFLNLAWVRIPQNTTSPSAHVAFEFNQGSKSCGNNSGGLVQRSAGDMLVVYDFEGGSTDNPHITLRRWVTSGACEISSDTAPCWGTATDLTTAGFAEAKVNTTTSVTDALAPPALSSTTGNATTATLGVNEFGEAGIDLSAAGVFSSASCTSFGQAFGVSRTSGNSGTAQMKDLVGPAQFNLSNCGTVITRKVTDPSPDPNDHSFGFTTNVATSPSTTTSPFSLKNGGSKTITSVLPNSYNVTEDDPSAAGYNLTKIDCSASTTATAPTTDLPTRKATFTVGPGETVDCTFTNTLQQGALLIKKESTKTGNPLVSKAGAVFTIGNKTVVDNNSTTGDYTDADSTKGEVCVSGLQAGPYTVNEKTPPSGYGAADPSQADQSVTVANGTNCSDNLPGDAATATFTNPPLGEIQVQFRDLGSGETSSSIVCADSTPTTLNAVQENGQADPASDDTNETFTNLPPGTYNCKVVVDP